MNTQNIVTFSLEHQAVFITFVVILATWSLAWKGLALWRSARNNHMWWFVVLLLVNTLGLLELFYLFVWPKINKKSEPAVR